MRHYETVFIISPELTEDDTQVVVDKFTGILADSGAMLTKVDVWGRRRLAYVVKKFNKGFYVLMDYVGSADVVAEIERNMRLDDRILKYMTVKLADSVDPESFKASAAEPLQEAEETVTPEEEQAQSSEVQESEEEEA